MWNQTIFNNSDISEEQYITTGKAILGKTVYLI